MVRIVRAIGTFGQFGAIYAIVSFPILWAFIFIIFAVLPHVLGLLGQAHTPPPDTAKLDEIKGLLFALYGFSWFGGIADAWRDLFPSKLDRSIGKVFREVELKDKTDKPQARRLITVLTGPWWMFVGFTILRVYTAEDSGQNVDNMMGGATTLFAFSAVTIAISISVHLIFKTLQWVKTGSEE